MEIFAPGPFNCLIMCFYMPNKYTTSWSSHEYVSCMSLCSSGQTYMFQGSGDKEIRCDYDMTVFENIKGAVTGVYT